MSATKRTLDYDRLSARELRGATAQFDEDMVVARSRRLTAAEKKQWQAARRKVGRPRRGAGVKVISVSVERELLARSDAFAEAQGISRASLIERGLRAVLPGRVQ